MQQSPRQRKQSSIFLFLQEEIVSSISHLIFLLSEEFSIIFLFNTDSDEQRLSCFHFIKKLFFSCLQEALFKIIFYILLWMSYFIFIGCISKGFLVFPMIS